MACFGRLKSAPSHQERSKAELGRDDKERERERDREEERDVVGGVWRREGVADGGSWE